MNYFVLLPIILVHCCTLYMSDIDVTDVDPFNARVVWEDVENEDGYNVIIKGFIIHTLPKDSTELLLSLKPNKFYEICIEAFNAKEKNKKCTWFSSPNVESVEIEYFFYEDKNSDGVYSYWSESFDRYCDETTACRLELVVSQNNKTKLHAFNIQNDYTVNFIIDQYYNAKIDGTLFTKAGVFKNSKFVSTTKRKLNLEIGYQEENDDVR